MSDLTHAGDRRQMNVAMDDVVKKVTIEAGFASLRKTLARRFGVDEEELHVHYVDGSDKISVTDDDDLREFIMFNGAQLRVTRDDRVLLESLGGYGGRAVNADWPAGAVPLGAKLKRIATPSPIARRSIGSHERESDEKDTPRTVELWAPPSVRGITFAAVARGAHRKIEPTFLREPFPPLGKSISAKSSETSEESVGPGEAVQPPPSTKGAWAYHSKGGAPKQSKWRSCKWYQSGSCKFPADKCNFLHICIACKGNHPRANCDQY